MNATNLAVAERIRVGQTALFLFNSNDRQLYGVFSAISAVGYNLQPDAWQQLPVREGAPSDVTPFPLQARVQLVHRFPPLPEVSHATGLRHWAAPLRCATGLRHCAAPLRCTTALRHWAALLGCATALRHWAAPLRCATGLRHCAAPLGCATALRHWAAPLGCATGLRHWAAPLGYATGLCQCGGPQPRLRAARGGVR
jgi:hypothetical protein